MGLAKRLATGWPIGQPVANPSAISLEQLTDSQTSKSPAIFPHQHQIRAASSATREERGLAPSAVSVPFPPAATSSSHGRTGTDSVRGACPRSSCARSLKPFDVLFAGKIVPVPLCSRQQRHLPRLILTIEGLYKQTTVP